MTQPTEKTRVQVVPGRGRKIILLGVMSRLPVAGIVWQTVHYLLGFQRLGYDVYYVEAHACTPKMLMQREDDDGSAKAAAFISGMMRRFDLGDRWAFHALHADGRYYGMSESQLKELYRSAALIINLHGATQPLPEHSATGRLVYLETDPVTLQIELHHNVQYTLDFLEPHCAFFTFGENYGKPDCGLPISERFDFRPTRQPVLTDLWRPHGNGDGRTFTTVGSWRQSREITFGGEIYNWSKHNEFMKVLDLPGRTNQAFELALAGCGETDRLTLESKGWKVREALALSTNADAYRRYIAQSRGEFTAAKDQNVRLHSGWFSDRSATYLAAGRPVVTQETGFSNILPTGQGLFAFAGMEEAVQALESINSDYERHRKAASALAEEYFGYDVVLTRLLADLGLPSSLGTSRPAPEAGTGPDATSVGEPAIPPEDTERVRTSPAVAHRSSPRPRCSVIVPVHNRAALTRRCLDALLGHASESSFETIVVDDASTDATRQLLAHYRGRIRLVRRETNGGFAAACNDGAAAASGEYLVFLNNDVVPNDRWLDALVRYAESHPKATTVGSKLLYPDGTIQHAGMVVCQDLYPRHLYAGFPADHPAVNKSRRFQIVTAASMLLRREPFEKAGGFDAAFLNGFEDVDLCLRLGERGHETHYCHESVGSHLEGVSEGRLKDEGKNLGLYRERWTQSLRPDDLQYYLEDGLLSLDYSRSFITAPATYPIRLKASPLLAVIDSDERESQSDRLLNLRSQQVFELLRETVRLTVRLQEAELRPETDKQIGFHHRTRDLTGGSEAARPEIDTLRQATTEPAVRLDASAAGAGLASSREDELRAMLLEAHEQLLRRDGEIESLVHDLQANLAAVLQQNAPDGGGEAGATNRSFVPGKYLRYRQLVRRIQEVAQTNLPPEATVIVVSRGDEALLELGDGRRGWHFPQEEGGVYAGHYPADSAEAITHLEELRSRGGEFLLLPETSFWWLEHYGGFRKHLEDRYQVFLCREETCLIFALSEPPETEHGGALAQARNAHTAHRDARA
jgi:GT2 family glycosyltransferase